MSAFTPDGRVNIVAGGLSISPASIEQDRKRHEQAGTKVIRCANGTACCQRTKVVPKTQTYWNCKWEHRTHAPRCKCC